jgi:hypothetical protein
MWVSIFPLCAVSVAWSVGMLVAHFLFGVEFFHTV